MRSLRVACVKPVCKERAVNEPIGPTSIEEFRGSPFLEVVEMGAAPHVEANTITIDAGAVNFGVEHRFLTGEILTAVYGADVAKRAMAGRFGAPDLDMSAPTLGDLITRLDERWPGMRDRVCEPGPQLREHINVFVDGRRERDLGAPLTDASVVHIIPAVAGGS